MTFEEANKLIKEAYNNMDITKEGSVEAYTKAYSNFEINRLGTICHRCLHKVECFNFSQNIMNCKFYEEST